MHHFEMAAELHVDRVDTHALLQMHPVSGPRREYCTCGLFEGSARRARGPDVCLREVGGDFRAARGQSRHASTGANLKRHQSNSVRFAGSAQMLAQAGSLRAPPMAEVATCTFLYMRFEVRPAPAREDDHSRRSEAVRQPREVRLLPRHRGAPSLTITSGKSVACFCR